MSQLLAACAAATAVSTPPEMPRTPAQDVPESAPDDRKRCDAA
jgi:hypothetical protein